MLTTTLLCGHADDVVAPFETSRALKTWQSVNDGVMGGVSSGRFRLSDENTLVFEGELSLKNNGGFSSIRSGVRPIEFKAASGIVIQLKGDGRDYYLDLRTSDGFRGSSYRALVPTTLDEFLEIRVPYSSFYFQRYGRRISTDPIDPSLIRSVGITLSDGKAGPFKLEIESIKTYGDDTTSADVQQDENMIAFASSAGRFKTLLAAVEAAGLTETLSSGGPFTLLAPTDEAFAALPEGMIERLLLQENQQKLMEILKYHVIDSPLTLATALEKQELTTLQGQTFSVVFTEGRIKIDEANLLSADLKVSNGIIHVIDKVLVPSESSLPSASLQDLIMLAVRRGVPMFNNGNAEATVAIYEVVCEALAMMEKVPEDAKQDLMTSLKKMRSSDSWQESAWILRYALDRTKARLNEVD